MIWFLYNWLLILDRVVVENGKKCENLSFDVEVDRMENQRDSGKCKTQNQSGISFVVPKEVK